MEQVTFDLPWMIGNLIMCRRKGKSRTFDNGYFDKMYSSIRFKFNILSKYNYTCSNSFELRYGVCDIN